MSSLRVIVVKSMMSVSKRDLGFAFILSTGALLTGVLIANGALLFQTARPVATAGVLSGIVPSLAFASSRCWLPRTQLSDEQIWRVAAWGGLGIAVLTAVDMGIILVHMFAQPIVDVGVVSLMGHVGLGGVGGVIVGSAWELNVNARNLHERNTVMNRILRHNLRNDINVIQGSTKLIQEGKGNPVKHAERISAKVDELMKVSEQVRRIQETSDPDRLSGNRVDAVDVLEDRLKLLRRTHPGVRINSSVPPEAWVYADNLLDAILDNVMENAIEHNDDQVVISVEVERDEVVGTVKIIITDNGPGIPDSEIEVLNEGRETQLQHSTGTGLWLVKWYVEQNNGTLRIKSMDNGSQVELELPACINRPRTGNPMSWIRWFLRLTRV